MTIDMAVAKIDIRALDEKPNLLKIKVARTYVAAEIIHRLERRIDDMFTSVRDKMKKTRDTMLSASTGRGSR